MSDTTTVHRWNGTDYRTILDKADSKGAMSIVHSVSGPLEGPPTHVHDHEDEVFVVLEGEMEFEVAGQRFRRGPMGTAFVPRGVPHSFLTGPHGARGLAVLTPGGFEGFFAEMAAEQFRLPQDIAAVAGVAARYGSRFVGPGLAQRSADHA